MKRMLKHIALNGQVCLFMLISLTSTFGQTGDCLNEDNNLLEKYWASREDLRNNFVVNSIDEVTGDLLSDGIGTFDCDNNTYTMFGQGIPANYIVANPNASNEDNNYENTAHWGDATIYLGRYIATLCTEYELLGRNGQIAAKKRTLNELFLALQAYRRINMTANRLYRRYQECTGIDCPAAPDLSGYSGFFIRDDVRWSLEEQFSDDWEDENNISSSWIADSECYNVEFKDSNGYAFDYPCDTTGVPCQFQGCRNLCT